MVLVHVSMMITKPAATGLIEWLYAEKADTVIIGGLATEEAISRTAEQLLWYNDSLHIIVNLAACHCYAPESTIQAVYKMRKSGISVVSNAEEIPRTNAPLC